MRKEKKVLPLSAIGYFAVAARHLNFNHAAAEVGITPGAMSLRVKALEENIGHPLFVRGTRGVTLTPDGERLKEIADFAIRQLEGVICDIREGSRREKLVVTVSPYFGSKWLASRLVGFWLSQPDIDLQLRRYREDLTFEEMNTDVLIRYGKGTPSDLVCKTLIPARTVAICGPTFLAARKSPDLSIFEEGPLLHVGSRSDWADWLEAIGHPREWAESGQVVEDIHVAIEAAATLAHRMVDAVEHALLGWGLTPGRPLAFHPPAADLARLQRIGEIDNDDDVALIAFHFRGQEGVGSVELETMDTAAACAEQGNLARPLAVGNIEQPQARFQFRGYVELGKGLAVDHHQPILRAHLVAVHVEGHLERPHGRFGGTVQDSLR